MVHCVMPQPLRVTFARWCRSTRIELDISQAELAQALGVSRSLVAAYESGRRVPDLDMVERIARAMDVRLGLDLRRPVVLGTARESDLLHARCSGHAGRRLASAGLQVAREVGIVDGRMRGWIDLLAFDTRTGRLLIIEIKTAIDDVGVIERQIDWYERGAISAARDRGWDVHGVTSWLLVLATEEVDAALARQRDVFAAAFPERAATMRAMLTSGMQGGRGLALIDPARRRSEWLLSTRLDGRRTAAPYLDRADAIRRLAPSPPVPMSRRVASRR